MKCQFTLDGDKLHIGPASTTQKARAPTQLQREDRDLTTLEFVVTARVRPTGGWSCSTPKVTAKCVPFGSRPPPEQP